MTRRRRLVLAGGLVAAATIAAPVLASLALDDDALQVSKWRNAVVQFDDRGEVATVVVVYDAGERDRAERLEIEQDPKPGVGITVALLLAPEGGDRPVRAVSDIRCVKARVRGLRPPHGAGIAVTDRHDDEVEGLGVPDAGFVLPPLGRCRTVDAVVLD
jgi:hypothetical protein